jgi:hypothetical protein
VVQQQQLLRLNQPLWLLPRRLVVRLLLLVLLLLDVQLAQLSLPPRQLPELHLLDDLHLLRLPRLPLLQECKKYNYK